MPAQPCQLYSPSSTSPGHFSNRFSHKFILLLEQLVSLGSLYAGIWQHKLILVCQPTQWASSQGEVSFFVFCFSIFFVIDVVAPGYNLCLDSRITEWIMSVLYVKHTEVSFEVKKKKNELIKKTLMFPPRLNYWLCVVDSFPRAIYAHWPPMS